MNKSKEMFLCHVVGSMKYVNVIILQQKLREHHGNVKKHNMKVRRTWLQLSYSRSILGHSCNSSEVWRSSAKHSSYLEEIVSLLVKLHQSGRCVANFIGSKRHAHPKLCLHIFAPPLFKATGGKVGRLLKTAPPSCRPLSTHAHSQSISLNIIGFLSQTVKKYRCICIQI